ncbi:MAG TPA: pyridoxal-phosphate dependent enzyme [Vicinamibacterales bacterium]|nr:pyridoxal-phosphate dependent enzyme [Vicinamibacterales bacterium]
MLTASVAARGERAGAAPPLEALVGKTPLVRLRAYEPKSGVEIYAKLESRNPGGSVKDRAALAMIRDGEQRGRLAPGRTLLDATSGNTGIAYAVLAAARAYRVRLCVPANVTAERTRLLSALGADLVLTDPMEGSDGAIREARRLYERDPDAYFYPDQYSNAANWRAHYETTGVEIIEQSAGRVTHFVAGLGTSGTFVGAGRRLRVWRPSVQLVSVQPDSPLHGLEGLKHMASAIVPPIYDPALADRALSVPTEEAYALTRQLAREHGVFVGPSSGAALAGCLRLAATLDRGVIVTIFPDGGDRYLSERFWDAPGRSSVALPTQAAAALDAHAAEAYPEECCGALIGPRPGDVAQVVPLGNTTAGERRRRFLVGPADYRRAERIAAEAGHELLGFYHSHPDHPAVPSAFDLEHALPNLSYVIVSVRQGRAVDLRSWRLRPDRSQFDEEPVARPPSRS